MSTRRGFRATVHGRVQGVGFRYYTRSMASRLGLRGYVQNLPDGSVRVEAEGGEAGLRRFAEWLETGPPSARVSSVDVQWRDTTVGYPAFTVEY
jgi:acylphosphatase